MKSLKKFQNEHKFNARGRYHEYKGKQRYFASSAEADRYIQLVKLEKENKITNLEIQPAYNVVVNNVRICQYRADFRYFTLEDNNYRGYQVIEDVKGMITDMYKLKKKLVEATEGIRIKEIPAKDIPKWVDTIPLNQ